MFPNYWQKLRNARRYLERRIELWGEHQALLEQLKPIKPLPRLLGWAILPDLGNLLIDKILEKRPETVVECGSGVSTLIIGYCLKALGQGRLLSLEHDRRTAQETGRQIKEHQLENFVEVLWQPLRRLPLVQGAFAWYDLGFLDKIQAIDLLLVDGPPAHLQPLSRYPAGPVLFPYLRSGGLVILDDADRAEEKAVVKKWREQFFDFDFRYKPTIRGAAILEKQPLVSVIIPAFNAASTIGAALEAMIGQTYKHLEIIVVDDNSTDNLAEAVRPYLEKDPRIHYEKLPWDDPERFNRAGVNINAGWQARNYGADLARGNYLVFQDADDGSLANRIEVQFQLMQKYNSHHAVVDWQPFKEGLNGKILNFEEPQIIESQEILPLAKKTGPRFSQWWLPTVFPEDNLLVRWLKRFDRQLLRRWDAYPLAANSAMVRKEVFDKVRFRPLRERTRPSQKGRGADRDFNFAVAETFKNSIAIKLPLYLWRV